MLEITDAAQREIAFRLKGERQRYIRIYVEESGCAGPSFSMVFDMPRASDYVYSVDDLTYVVDKQLMDNAEHITVDFGPCTFNIISGLKDCGSCCSCGASGCCTSRQNA